MDYDIKSMEDFEAYKRRFVAPKPDVPEDVQTQTEQAIEAPATKAPVEIKNMDDFEVYKRKFVAPEDDTPFDPSETLKKDDLKTGERVRAIRAHMVDYRGVDYKVGAGKSDDEVVEDFVDNMRWMNSNIGALTSTVRFISNADGDTKQRAGEAYKLYDQLGNVFTNDGFAGAVDGMKDYLFATATDPSTYLGLATGGLGKAAGVGLTQAGRALVKKTAIEAGKAAIKKGATQEAAKSASDAAFKQATKRFAANKVKAPQSLAVRKEAARTEQKLFLLAAKKKAQRDVVNAAARKDGTKILAATTAGDAAFAVIHDVTLQNTLIAAGAQEEYSKLQTGFSSLLGGIGGVAQLGMRQLSGASGLSDAPDNLRIGGLRTEAEDRVGTALESFGAKAKVLDLSLDEKQVTEAADIVLKSAESWRAKVSRGKDSFDDVPTSIDFLAEVMLGTKKPDGTKEANGLIHFFKAQGMPLPKGAMVSDVMTTLATRLPQETLKEINDTIRPMGITLGDTAAWGQQLGDLLSVEISKGGQALNVMSQVRKTLDAATVQGHTVLENSYDAIVTLEKEAVKAKRAKTLAYGQSIWRRLLVSSPATTAANLSGYAQFATGQTLADILSGTAYTVYGLAKGGVNTKAGREAMRVGRIYREMQGQRMRNLMDPYTTKDAYMAFLNQNKKVSKTLFETFSGGVQRGADRFGMDPESTGFKAAEVIADAANRITGVPAQDTFTKSQMFITELDKWTRLNKDVTLEDVFKSGDLSLIDDEIIGNALDTTVKSVFTKDYTTDDQMLSQVAGLVEKVSNTPFLGTIVPFGRFLNNVVATSYQWSAGGLMQFAPAMYKTTFEGVPMPKTATEALARSAVGLSALSLAISYDENKSDRTRPYNHVSIGGGAYMDASTQFPASLFLIGGRILNLVRRGEDVSQDLMKDLGAQVAIGQLSEDAEFANDFYNTLDMMLNQEEGARKASLDMLYKPAGNFAAGFTRPLDAVNRMVGFINNSDAARDARQATGADLGVINATKYVDNIIEVFTDQLDNVTGEELRVATREGSIRDVAPVARILGINVVPPRTAAEKVHQAADVHVYKANQRTQVAEYDKVFNTLIQPMFEERLAVLEGTKGFKEASPEKRRLLLTQWKAGLRQEIRDTMEAPSKHGLLATRKKAASVESNLKGLALDMVKEQFGSVSSFRDMNWEELQYYFEVIDIIKDDVKDAQ